MNQENTPAGIPKDRDEVIDMTEMVNEALINIIKRDHKPIKTLKTGFFKELGLDSI